MDIQTYEASIEGFPVAPSTDIQTSGGTTRAEFLIFGRLVKERAKVKSGSLTIEKAQIVLHQPISAGRNTLTFSLNGSNNPSGFQNDENIPLGLNDAFMATGVALRIKQCLRPKGTSAPYSGANTRAVTFVDLNTFAADEAFALRNLYNGRWSFKTANKMRIDGMPTTDLEFVPQTQGNAAAGNFSNSTGGFGDAASRGYYHIGGYPLIMGGETNEITVNLGNGVKTAIDGSATGLTVGGKDYDKQNYAVVIVDGFVLRGGDKAKAALASWD